MPALIANTFVSLDGIAQAPGGPAEDPSGGFTLGGWSVPWWDHVMDERMTALMDHPFDLVLGRRTFEIFAAHWPHVDDDERAARGGTKPAVDDPVAAAINGAVKHVASTTSTSLGWANSRLLGADVAAAVATLKAGNGPELQVHGSVGLLQTLMAHGLVDEHRLLVFPIVLGRGKRLFADGVVPHSFALVDHAVSTTGVVIATYQRTGDVDTGSFAFEVPTDAEVERRRRLADEGV